MPDAVRCQVGEEAYAAWMAGTLDSFSVHAPPLLHAQASSLRESVASAAVRVVRNQEQLLVAQAEAASQRAELAALGERLASERLLLEWGRAEAERGRVARALGRSARRCLLCVVGGGCARTPAHSRRLCVWQRGEFGRLGSLAERGRPPGGRLDLRAG